MSAIIIKAALINIFILIMDEMTQRVAFIYLGEKQDFISNVPFSPVKLTHLKSVQCESQQMFHFALFPELSTMTMNEALK